MAEHALTPAESMLLHKNIDMDIYLTDNANLVDREVCMFTCELTKYESELIASFHTNDNYVSPRAMLAISEAHMQLIQHFKKHIVSIEFHKFGEHCKWHDMATVPTPKQLEFRQNLIIDVHKRIQEALHVCKLVIRKIHKHLMALVMAYQRDDLATKNYPSRNVEALPSDYATQMSTKITNIITERCLELEDEWPCQMVYRFRRNAKGEIVAVVVAGGNVFANQPQQLQQPQQPSA